VSHGNPVRVGLTKLLLVPVFAQTLFPLMRGHLVALALSSAGQTGSPFYGEALI
jgi:hypothetical protein